MIVIVSCAIEINLVYLRSILDGSMIVMFSGLLGITLFEGYSG